MKAWRYTSVQTNLRTWYQYVIMVIIMIVFLVVEIKPIAPRGRSITKLPDIYVLG